MSAAREDSPVASRPSNRTSLSLLRHVAEACRVAVEPPRAGDAAVDRMLRLAVRATRTERAFLVRIAPASAEGPIVEAYHGPPDRRGAPSRTALRIALARGRPLVCPNLDDDDPLLRGESVRSLALRTVLVTAVPTGPPERLLVFDGRAPADALPASLADALEAFAALIGLCLTSATLDGPPDLGSTAARDLAPRSVAMRDALEWAGRAARTDLPVLVRGETGSGKERFARQIHAQSRRRAGPLQTINCAALPEALLEGELFGSTRGSYTGADRDRPGLFRLAHSGTLFLDEIGEMPQVMQAKLLRALEDRRVRPVGASAEVEIDVRLVAATHRDLEALVERGDFRGDLLYRLAVLEVLVPPLRERIQDLPSLVAELGPALARDTGCGLPRLTDCAWRELEAHPWPGNVRELRSVLARAILRAGSSAVTARHLVELSATRRGSTGASSADSLERRMIREALLASGGLLADAAARIGWTRQKLHRRMRAVGVLRPARGSVDSGLLGRR